MWAFLKVPTQNKYNFFLIFIAASLPFRISFFSDGLEQSAAADGINSYGFKLSYFQRSC